MLALRGSWRLQHCQSHASLRTHYSSCAAYHVRHRASSAAFATAHQDVAKRASSISQPLQQPSAFDSLPKSASVESSSVLHNDEDPSISNSVGNSSSSNLTRHGLMPVHNQPSATSSAGSKRLPAAPPGSDSYQAAAWLFDEGYRQSLLEFQDMLTPEMLQELQNTLPLKELQQLQSILADLEHLKEHGHFCENADATDMDDEPSLDAMQTLTVSALPPQPSDIYSYMRSLFEDVSDDQYMQILQALDASRLEQMDELYQEIRRFQSLPLDSLPEKYSELSQRMEALMAEVALNPSHASTPASAPTIDSLASTSQPIIQAANNGQDFQQQQQQRQWQQQQQRQWQQQQQQQGAWGGTWARKGAKLPSQRSSAQPAQHSMTSTAPSSSSNQPPAPSVASPSQHSDSNSQLAGARPLPTGPATFKRTFLQGGARKQANAGRNGKIKKQGPLFPRPPAPPEEEDW